MTVVVPDASEIPDHVKEIRLLGVHLGVVAGDKMEGEATPSTKAILGGCRLDKTGSRRWPPLGGLKIGGLFKPLVEGDKQ